MVRLSHEMRQVKLGEKALKHGIKKIFVGILIAPPAIDRVPEGRWWQPIFQTAAHHFAEPFGFHALK